LVNLLTWWAPRPEDVSIIKIATSPFCKRDTQLCAQHARELESLLKGPAAQLDESAGEA
jgi:hypothetical protein